MDVLKPIYSGKAKSVYTTEDPNLLRMHFRDDATAFDGTKKDSLPGKGRINNLINAHIMHQLIQAGIETHFVKVISDTDTLVKSLDMIPVECVVRNYAAGSLCKRLSIKEGITLEPPIMEFFLKNDGLHDPMINEAHIKTFNWASDEEVHIMKSLTFQVNAVLRPLFLEAGLLLVDYKLEFGRCDGKILLGDEFSPDGCRLWDAETLEKMDKDRFRRDLGGVVEAYQEVASRLGIDLA